MTALAAIRTTKRAPAMRIEFPRCPVCADSMIAAEASVLQPEDRVTHLWSCDTCGYGFVTQCDVEPIPS